MFFSQFQLGEVSQFAAHQENGRLMGFVVESRDWSDGDEEGEPSYSAFVFESNTEGEKVGASNTLFFNKERRVMSLLHRWILRFTSFCFYSQICYTISLAKDITEAKKVLSSWKQIYFTLFYLVLVLSWQHLKCWCCNLVLILQNSEAAKQNY